MVLSITCLERPAWLRPGSVGRLCAVRLVDRAEGLSLAAARAVDGASEHGKCGTHPADRVDYRSR